LKINFDKETLLACEVMPFSVDTPKTHKYI